MFIDVVGKAPATSDFANRYFAILLDERSKSKVETFSKLLATMSFDNVLLLMALLARNAN